MAKTKRAGEYAMVLKVCRQRWAWNNAARKLCFANAKTTVNEGKLDKWKCACCNLNFAQSEVQCDHVVPIGNTIPVTLEELIECLLKLYVPIEKLQILCKGCHSAKTKFQGNEKKKHILIENIAFYLGKETNWLKEQFGNIPIVDHKMLKKMNKLIDKINEAGNVNKAKYQKKLDKLTQVYL